MVEPYETENKSKNNDTAIEDYAAELIDDYTLKTLNDTDEIWYYNDEAGIFLPNAEPIVKARISPI